MSDTPENMPAGAELRGHNNPPELLDAESLLARLNGPADEPGSCARMADDATELLARIGGRKEGATPAPAVVETDADNGIIAGYMAELRDQLKAVIGTHSAKKAPYLASGRVCDNFFFSIRDRLMTTQAILQRRGDDYTARKVAEERRQRQLDADRAAATLRETEAKRIAAENEARALAAAAERARKPENIERLEAAAENKVATAAMLQVDEMIAESKVDTAMIAAASSSADIARTRHEDGHLSTARQVGYADIIPEDADQIDLNKLRPYLPVKAIESALKAWAKATDYKIQMPGAKIGKRDKADYRG